MFHSLIITGANKKSRAGEAEKIRSQYNSSPLEVDPDCLLLNQGTIEAIRQAKIPKRVMTIKSSIKVKPLFFIFLHLLFLVKFQITNNKLQTNNSLIRIYSFLIRVNSRLSIILKLRGEIIYRHNHRDYQKPHSHP